MDQSFLKDVQAKGWPIELVTEDLVVSPCPNLSCNVRVNLKNGTKIPTACKPGVEPRSQVVTVFDDARVFLRARREELRFTIRDVESISGMADDFLAKFEKEKPSKYPNVQTFVEWAQSLGFKVVLMPAELPPLALRILAETRHLIPSRDQMTAQHHARRVASAERSQKG